jgi:hypothetical protein
MALDLHVRIEVDGRPDLRSGWRGLLDFGERWTEEDAQLWPSGSGSVPVGEPLVYGCELRWLQNEDTERKAVLTLWSIDAPRSVMTNGATFRLLEGATLRATGELRE